MLAYGSCLPFQEECLGALKHKTPTVVSETCKFLGRCFTKCPPQLVANKKATKGYVSALLERLGHADGTVRDSASEALGALWKYLGDAVLGKLTVDVDSVKLAKIKEYCEKTTLTGKPAPVGGSGGAVAAVKKGPKVVKPPPAAAAAEKAEKPKPKPASAGAKAPSRPAAGAAAASAPPSKQPRAAAAAPSSSRKKGEDVDTSPLYAASNLKNARFKVKKDHVTM